MPQVSLAVWQQGDLDMDTLTVMKDDVVMDVSSSNDAIDVSQVR